MIKLEISREDYQTIQRLIGDKQFETRKELEQAKILGNPLAIKLLDRRLGALYDLGTRLVNSAFNYYGKS